MANRDEAYICLSAILRAREPRLLNNDRAERMIDAPTFEEAARMVTDCGYPDMSQMNAQEIEAALEKHRAEIFAEMKRLAPDDGIVDIFRTKYDYHNAKVILKSEAMQINSDHLLSQAGRIEPDKLQYAYTEENYSSLPGRLAEGMKSAREILAKLYNPQAADFALDREYFAELADAAERSGKDFIKDYVKLLTDAANLKSTVRSMKMGKSSGFLQDALIGGGTVDTAKLLAAEDGADIAEAFRHTALECAAALGAETAAGASMTAFELACDNAVNAYLRKSGYVTFGPEPLVAYLAATESEITAIRMILTCRLAGVAPATIRERLRDMYA